MDNNTSNIGGDEGSSCGSVRGGPTPCRTPTPCGTPSLRSTPSPAPSCGRGKIISRNVNGTMTVTSVPTNEAELQLYRVMQRASLLSYYDTLLEMGGDDVQQLCDAGEEEFLEIMALIGMASKPLHVRRLQKALQEWMTNPALFQLPLISISCGELVPPGPRLLLPQMTASVARKPSPERISGVPTPSLSPAAVDFCTTTVTATLTAASNSLQTEACGGVGGATQPALTEAQIAQIAESADRLTRLLPHDTPKQSSTKKKIGKDLEQVMLMAESDPRRMDEIRRWAAIYGRFDQRREKPLTQHEVLVNEAAAQLCRARPTLLARRHELFPLARQLVRDLPPPPPSPTMSPARVRSLSTNSSDSESCTSIGGGDILPAPSPATVVNCTMSSPRSVSSSPAR